MEFGGKYRRTYHVNDLTTYRKVVEQVDLLGEQLGRIVYRRDYDDDDDSVTIYFEVTKSTYCTIESMNLFYEQGVVLTPISDIEVIRPPKHEELYEQVKEVIEQ